jgi:hypothetical protein
MNDWERDKDVIPDIPDYMAETETNFCKSKKMTPSYVV